MMNCREASHLISQSRERRLPLLLRLQLRLHLLMCGACRQFALQLRLLRRMAGRYGARVENDVRLKLSNDARSRITHAMQEQRGAIESARQNPDQNFTG